MMNWIDRVGNFSWAAAHPLEREKTNPATIRIKNTFRWLFILPPYLKNETTF
jgi:hypothetical protein